MAQYSEKPSFTAQPPVGQSKPNHSQSLRGWLFTHFDNLPTYITKRERSPHRTPTPLHKINQNRPPSNLGETLLFINVMYDIHVITYDRRSTTGVGLHISITWYGQKLLPRRMLEPFWPIPFGDFKYSAIPNSHTYWIKSYLFAIFGSAPRFMMNVLFPQVFLHKNSFIFTHPIIPPMSGSTAVPHGSLESSPHPATMVDDLRRKPPPRHRKLGGFGGGARGQQALHDVRVAHPNLEAVSAAQIGRRSEEGVTVEVKQRTGLLQSKGHRWRLKALIWFTVSRTFWKW